ncbi:MAG: hypothetical protein M1825_002787 [Sarcosagium campestre]|nr:MAG: hypothetical protein M1825_002787 [Sarcosagium campestre]
MASTATAGASGSNSNKHQSNKANAGSKATETARKSSGSPVDSNPRRVSTHKAWTQGTNPITQRPNNSFHANGLTPQPNGPAKTPNETETQERHAKDRFKFLYSNFVGRKAKITLDKGDIFEGIFSAASLEPAEICYVLKMAKRIKRTNSSETNGSPHIESEYIGAGTDHTVVFQIKDVVDLVVEGVTLLEPTQAKTSNGTASGFRTDADISGNLALRERTLQRWQPSGETDVDLSLEGNSGKWDQFEINNRLFGVKSDYDENFYTTVIDRSAPDYGQREAAAARLAREIESGATSNAHLAEERGQSVGDDSGANEEDKYSALPRGASELAGTGANSTQDKYTPPARRPPVSRTPATGPAMDPAIISAKMGTKAPAEGKGQQPSSGISTGPSGSVSPLPKAPVESATATVENDVRDAFRQFASTEKMRVQERRRNQAKHDKDIKLNDLKRFSKNFKLLTPVPKDLVPILAKDKETQERIVERAQRAAHEATERPSTSQLKPSAPDMKVQRSVPSSKFDAAAPSNSGSHDRQTSASQRGRNGQQPSSTYASNARQGPQSPVGPGRPRQELGQRLANMQNNKIGTHAPGISAPGSAHEIRAPPVGPASISATLQQPQTYGHAPTPTSASSSKFNVKALEFRPNPAAVSFTPTGNASNASSPRSNYNARPASRIATPSGFFGHRKPLRKAQRGISNDLFNPIVRLKRENATNKDDTGLVGGVPPPHRTAPRWDVHEDNKERSYTEMFERVPSRVNTAQNSQQSTPQLAHQHQLPFHLQHPIPNGPAQPPISTSSPSVLASPRLQPSHLSYQPPMGPQAHPVYPQPMPPYGMNGPPMVRQHSGAPPFPQQHGGPMGAPMMARGPSNGSYMGAPPGMPAHFSGGMPMFAPPNMHGYPQQGGPPPPHPGSNGFPSPGRGAPMMVHSTSQHGQPHHSMVMYGSSPGQHSHHNGYPPHHQGPGMNTTIHPHADLELIESRTEHAWGIYPTKPARNE